MCVQACFVFGLCCGLCGGLRATMTANSTFCPRRFYIHPAHHTICTSPTPFLPLCAHRSSSGYNQGNEWDVSDVASPASVRTDAGPATPATPSAAYTPGPGSVNPPITPGWDQAYSAATPAGMTPGRCIALC